jgi:hypothetical protein
MTPGITTHDRAFATVAVENRPDDGQQGRLSAAGRTDEQEQLPGVDLQVDATERRDRRLTGAERLGHASAPNDCPGW